MEPIIPRSRTQNRLHLAAVEDNAAKSRSSLHEMLVSRLREMIVEGRLERGARIAELQLCESFGVSRTPLREALKVLAAEGLVDLFTNRGAWVANPSLEDLRELFTVIAALDGLAGELAAVRITEEELAAIRVLHTDLVSAFHEGDRHQYFRLNQAIHDSILEAAANSALKAAHGSVSGRILGVRFRSNLSPARWDESVREHEVIMHLLELRRPTELGQFLRAHIMNKFDAICAATGHVTAALEEAS